MIKLSAFILFLAFVPMFLFKSANGDMYDFYNSVYNILTALGAALMILATYFEKKDWQYLPAASFFFIIAIIFTINEFCDKRYDTIKPVFFTFKLVCIIYIGSIFYDVIKYFRK